eukprot:2799551-Pleurochrysis_carterae.AAC.2
MSQTPVRSGKADESISSDALMSEQKSSKARKSRRSVRGRRDALAALRTPVALFSESCRVSASLDSTMRNQFMQIALMEWQARSNSAERSAFSM